jgi:caa(3)-type oxidase subunit IV
MSDAHAAEHAHEAHSHPNYWNVYKWLMVLLVISVAGPFLGIKVVTLITAFGIAVVKAYLVLRNFMHINIEPRFVTYFITTTLVFMLLFFTATAPDVMKASGHNWAKDANWHHVPAPAAHGAHSGAEPAAHP